jgi:uncharacterized membrane-anchored protein
MMEKKKIQLFALAALSVFIIGVPLSLIVRQESLLSQGQEFRFRTTPVDPWDAFRGRYVALQLDQAEATITDNQKLRFGQEVYASIGVGNDGFAGFTTVSVTPPNQGPYMKCRARGQIQNGKMLLRLPVDRYYMEESKAPKAERLYVRHSQQKFRDAFVVVRINRGNVAVKALYVGGKPIEEALRESENAQGESR